MPGAETFSFVRRLSQAGTLLHTLLHGKEVGRDDAGNRYFEERGSPRASQGGRVRKKRWVLFSGEPEPTKVPPEWHIWLHYTSDKPLSGGDRFAWQKAHVANATGTTDAWLPPSLKGKSRPPATGDYQAWKPE